MSGQIKPVAILGDLVCDPSGDLDAAITVALARICDYSGASKATVFQLSDNAELQRSHASDAVSVDAAFLRLPVDLLSFWRTELDEGMTIHVPNVAALSDNAGAKAVFQTRGVSSLVLAPMRQAGQLSGLLCLEAVSKDCVFADAQLDLLESAAKVIQTLLARRTVESALVETASRLKAMLSALPDLLLEVDADGRYTGFISGPAHLLAAPADTLIGKRMESVLPPDAAEIIRAAQRDVFANGSVSGVRYRLELPDGEHVFELSGGLKPASAPNERPSAIFLVRDVTGTQRMTEEILLLGKIVQAMSNLVAIVDPEQRVVWVNAAFETQTGWRLDEIRGKDLGTLVRCPESDPATIAQVTEALALRKPFVGEMINQDRHGQQYWVDFNVMPLFDAEDNLQGYVSVETVVTKLKQQEVALAQLAQTAAAARMRLENALMALPDGVVIFDSDFRLISVNNAYREFFPELADSVVEGVYLGDLLRIGVERGIFLADASTEEKERWVAERLAAYREPKVIDEVQLPDGRWILRINIRTADMGCIAIGVDITVKRNYIATLDSINQDLVQALDERNKAEKRLAGIMDGAEVGTWEWDVAKGVFHIGGSWAAILGHGNTVGTLAIEEFGQMVHPDDMRILDATRTEDLARGESIIEREFRMRHSDGHWVWVLSRSRVTERTPDGAPLTVAGVHLDISDRKKLEQDIDAGRARLSQVMDTSIAAIVVMDPMGKIVYANHESEQILGLDRSVIQGRAYNDPAWNLERVDGSPLPDTELPYRRALAKGGSVRDVNFVLRWPDGTRRVLSCNATPLLIDDEPAQVVVSFTDVTERLAATAALENALARAEEMSRAKSIFLANMSHEIRTPLNGVLGMAEVLDSLVEEPDQKRMIGTIRNSGETLLNVLNSILDMSKIEAGKVVLEEVPLVLSDIVAQVEAVYTVQAEEKGIEFEVLSSARSDVARLGDPHRIQQILNNLLSNAIKFTERGSVTLKLSCKAGKPVSIEVSDTGIGMTQPQIDSAFDSFHQADGSMTRRFGGTGLGLSIVRQLVTLMGGEIILHSEAGRGTKVQVTLPLPETAIPRPVISEVSARLSNGAALKGLRILSADDNATNRMVLGEMLANTGVTLKQVENGQQAVDTWAAACAKADSFDVLLLDITMPVKDGLTALSEIRARETLQGITPVPAIAVTANAMPFQVSEYIIGGFDTHLSKPYKRTDLLHALQMLTVV